MYSVLSTFNTTTEVPLIKAPNPQLLPGRRSINGCPLLRGVCSRCVFTAVCVHFGWVNCRAQIPSMGHHTWAYVKSLCQWLPQRHKPCGEMGLQELQNCTNWVELTVSAPRSESFHFKVYSFFVEGALGWRMVSTTSVERPEATRCAPSWGHIHNFHHSEQGGQIVEPSRR